MESTIVEDTDKPANSEKSLIVRLLPLALIIAAIVAFFALDGSKYVTLQAVADNYGALSNFVADQRVLAVLIFVAMYIAVVTFSIPIAILMTPVGGLLFGAWEGTLWSVVSATIGATLLFLAAKLALGDALRRRAGPFVAKLEQGFTENAFNYLLFLRLVPAAPFWVVNLVPALTGVRVGTFVAATFIGIIPGAFVYSLAGEGFASVIAQGDKLTLTGVLTPPVIGAFVGLGLLALIPIVLKRFRKGK